MADARRPPAPRFAVTLAAIAATVGGWLAMAARDAPAPSAPDGGEALLPPIPTLEPRTRDVALPRVARRPIPVATTRSSR